MQTDLIVISSKEPGHNTPGFFMNSKSHELMLINVFSNFRSTTLLFSR
jgi:hypothetical protein